MNFATLERFEALGTRAGVPEEVLRSLWADLELRYSGNHRAYHNLDHLEKMLGMLVASGAGSDSIEWAIWFHDVIYDPKSKFNELESADYFCEVAGAYLEEGLIADIRRLILATDPSNPRSGKADEDLLVDLDLGILGASESDYEAYCVAVRKEYSFVPEADFAQGRVLILKRFLEGPIYATPYFEGLEPAARANLEAEIGRLECPIDANS
ncbi:hypothetical protein V2O64_09065 [Verrucomicrobiaceae bacterium 227]